MPIQRACILPKIHLTRDTSTGESLWHFLWRAETKSLQRARRTASRGIATGPGWLIEILVKQAGHTDDTGATVKIWPRRQDRQMEPLPAL